jgi:hypothetical protein
MRGALCALVSLAVCGYARLVPPSLLTPTARRAQCAATRQRAVVAGVRYEHVGSSDDEHVNVERCVYVCVRSHATAWVCDRSQRALAHRVRAQPHSMP